MNTNQKKTMPNNLTVALQLAEYYPDVCVESVVIDGIGKPREVDGGWWITKRVFVPNTMIEAKIKDLKDGK